MAKHFLQFLSDHLGWVGAALMAGIALWQVEKKSWQHRNAKKKLAKAVRNNSAEPISLHPQIDPAKCLGCGACTKVCPEGDILQLLNHKAVLVSPSKCVGHGECEAACPFDAISLVFGTKTRGVDIPRVTTNYETNIPGLYVAGELGGMGLIRNAVKQGAAAAAHAAANLDRGLQADCDILVIGAGPAGMAACLGATEHRATHICIEQNSFGGTVFNFPRQKIVMSRPAVLPIVGSMEFESDKVSKEDLLEYWDKIRRKVRLVINENEKFESLTVERGVFKVMTAKKTYLARKVILATGVRGSPRRLGLPNENLAKVTYNLVDPEQYQGQNIAVVGGGNAAAETVRYLGKRRLNNKVTMLVHGPALDRANEENISVIKKMQQEGLIDVWFNSQVKAIEETKITIQRSGKMVLLNNDFLFVNIGAEMPQKFLMGLGVTIDKKFGESLKKNKNEGRVA